ncbi:hypothetical protein QT726_22770, partial [Xanthomonas citri pv. citri]
MTDDTGISTTPVPETAGQRIRRWREHPGQMVRELFGTVPDAWQDDVLAAFPTNPRLAMKACKGPGKTAVLAWLCWNFMLCYLHPKIAAVSITADNLADGLWSEMSKWQKRAPLLQATFTWTKTRIYENANPETWFMSFRSWAKGGSAEQQADTLAGLHADNIMFVIDEAGGIPDAVMAAAEAGLANADGISLHAHLVMAGNPTHLSGPLYRATTSERHLWWLVEITSDPDDPKRTPRVSAEWARQQIEKYGRDNPWVLVNVFGKFPPSSMNALLGPDDVAAAMKRQPSDQSWRALARIIGVDVARFGDDASCKARRNGNVMFPLEIGRNMESLQGAGWVAQDARDFYKDQTNAKPDAVFVDDTGGWGAGWIDQLRALNYTVTGVGFAGKADDPRYFNKRTEMYFRLAHAIKHEGLCLPNDPDLSRELTAHTYYVQGDKMRVVEKDQVKEELGHSPDRSDAAALTYAYD